MNFKTIQKELKNNLKPARYKHTMGVVETASRLAKIHGNEVKQAELAALLHDCAKHISDEEKISLCREYGISISDAEYANPSLLHAKCGAILAEYEYGVTDPDILHAITVHTTGAINMNRLDKIIFIADYIEPGRDKAPHLPELRKLAEKDLDQTAYRIMEDTVSYLQNNETQTMDPATIEAFQFYKKLCSV